MLACQIFDTVIRKLVGRGKGMGVGGIGLDGGRQLVGRSLEWG